MNKNLVEVAAITKKIIILVSAGAFVLLSLWMIRNPAKDVFMALFPPKNPPLAKFGPLEPIQFVSIEQTGSPVRYTLNTNDGKLPKQIPDKIRIFKYKEKPFSYSAGKDAQEDAKFLGFSELMLISELSETKYIWEDITFGGNLIIDTTSGGLLLDTPLRGLGNLYPRTVISESDSARKAIEFLGSLKRNIDPTYFSPENSKIEVTYGKFGTYGLVKADSSLEAQATKVDFYRNINNIPVLPPNPYQAMIQVTMRNGKSDKHPQLNYPQVRILNWDINTEESDNYPLLPVQTAWESVKAGKGVVSGIKPVLSNPFYSLPVRIELKEVLVNEVYLAYYDSYEKQDFLQPIYVFQGNYSAANNSQGDITIYYPAIDPAMIKTVQIEQVLTETQ